MRRMSAGSINLTNQFLIAMPGLAGEPFAGTVIYLCEHTENGALGLVISTLGAPELTAPARRRCW